MSKRQFFRPTQAVDAKGTRLTPETVTVLNPIDPSTYDAEEVGPMFYVRYDDGRETQAFGDELS